MEPLYDYCIGKKIEKDSGVVTSTDITETHQYFEVLAVGPGRYENGVFIEPTVKVGDKVYIQKHATADTPKELESRDLVLFQSTRVMSRDGNDKN